MTDSPNTDHYQPTQQQAAALITRIDAMLPGVKASDERTARLNEASARRRMGLDLHPHEVIADLRDILDNLLRHINEYRGGVNRFMQTPAAMLAYSERATMYAMRDYPRTLADDTAVTGLWDSIDVCHTAARAWVKGEYPNSAAPAVIELIHRTAANALAGRYVTYTAADTEDTDSDD